MAAPGDDVQQLRSQVLALTDKVLQLTDQVEQLAKLQMQSQLQQQQAALRGEQLNVRTHNMLCHPPYLPMPNAAGEQPPVHVANGRQLRELGEPQLSQLLEFYGLPTPPQDEEARASRIWDALRVHLGIPSL